MVKNGSRVEYCCTLCKQVLRDVKQILPHKKLHSCARYVVIVKAKRTAMERNKAHAKAKKVEIFACICLQDFSTQKDYDQHRTVCELIVCHYCGSTCNKYKMHAHMLFKHKELKTFKCHMCDYVVNSSMKYVNHLNMQHETYDNTFMDNTHQIVLNGKVNKNGHGLSTEMERRNLSPDYLNKMKMRNRWNRYIKHVNSAQGNGATPSLGLTQRPFDYTRLPKETNVQGDTLSLTEDTSTIKTEDVIKQEIPDRIVISCDLCHNNFDSKEEFDFHFEQCENEYSKLINIDSESILCDQPSLTNDPLDTTDVRKTTDIIPTSSSNSSAVDNERSIESVDDSNKGTLNNLLNKKMNVGKVSRKRKVHFCRLCKKKFYSKKKFDSHIEACCNDHDKGSNVLHEGGSNEKLNSSQTSPNDINLDIDDRNFHLSKDSVDVDVTSMNAASSTSKNNTVATNGENLNESDTLNPTFCELSSTKFNSNQEFDSHIEVCTSTNKDFPKNAVDNNEALKTTNIIATSRNNSIHDNLPNNKMKEGKITKKRKTLYCGCGRRFNSKKYFDCHVEVCRNNKSSNVPHKNGGNQKLNSSQKSFDSIDTPKDTNVDIDDFNSPLSDNSLDVTSLNEASSSSQNNTSNTHSKNLNEKEPLDPTFCKLCSVKFSSKEELDSHLEACKSNRKKNNVPRICDICGKMFTCWLYLKRHLKLHRGIRNYLCHICGKQFRAANQFKLHLFTVHYNCRKYKCEVCEDSFATATKLKRHMMWHTGEKPFRCELCNKQCIQKINLKRHVCRPPT